MSEEIAKRVVTVDIIIEIYDYRDVYQGIVLAERKNEPLGTCIPGGVVDVGETCEAAAVREAFEETGLVLKEDELELLGVWSSPGRDPRGETCSIVYVAQSESGALPVGADDVRDAWIWNPGMNIPVMAFDHASIVRAYVRSGISGIR